ncbi:putative sporulation protein YtxC [Ectobacillus funiculus]|uniref:putative sporulation protein YtxC n=1 Tax=Ectobacillus funiculus TaxID=137993 RepID=UPI00101BEB65|nr:putative sporulation protein YtxC [Ectobacillus funiculus]
MIEIRFEEEHDARMMYEHLLKGAETAHESMSVLLEESTVVVHIPPGDVWCADEVLIPAIIRFITDVKEEKWILSILEQAFLYRDQDERMQILHIVHSLLDGKLQDIPYKGLQKERRSLLEASLAEFVQNPISFSFDSYVKFRLRYYMAYLVRLTELAIDEYKLEQEYQSFVELLRQHVYTRKPRLSCLHLVYNGSFTFYDERGSCLNQERLVQYIDEGIVYNQESYIDPNIIAPLLSIAPKTIYLYTAHIDDNMIITIRNVFQERVIVHTIGEFEKMMGKQVRKQ